MHSTTQPPLITLTSDFGAESHYVAQMKGVILGICRRAIIVDVNHRVSPQDVVEASRILPQIVGAFPADTLHVAVVDPGVGTDRSVVLLRTAKQYFIAPDNGLLWPLCQQSTPDWIRRLTQPEFWASHVSRTFHGRDIMAPVAAHLGNGVNPASLGPRITDLVPLSIQLPTSTSGHAAGQIVQIDNFGNLITNIDATHVGHLATPIAVRLPTRGFVCHEWVGTYGERPAGTLVALIGSNGQLEIAEVEGSAAGRIGAQIGDSVQVGPVE